MDTQILVQSDFIASDTITFEFEDKIWLTWFDTYNKINMKYQDFLFSIGLMNLNFNDRIYKIIDRKKYIWAKVKYGI